MKIVSCYLKIRRILNEYMNNPRGYNIWQLVNRINISIRNTWGEHSIVRDIFDRDFFQNALRQVIRTQPMESQREVNERLGEGGLRNEFDERWEELIHQVNLTEVRQFPPRETLNESDSDSGVRTPEPDNEKIFTNIVKYFYDETQNKTYRHITKNNSNIILNSCFFGNGNWTKGFTPVEKCKGDDNDDYICPISRDIIRVPLITQCGHTFDKFCLQKNINYNNLNCPLCNATILNYSINEDLMTKIDEKYDFVLHGTDIKVDRMMINAFYEMLIWE